MAAHTVCSMLRSLARLEAKKHAETEGPQQDSTTMQHG